MKRRKRPSGVGARIWSEVDGQLRRELWVPCKVFAVSIGRPYKTVLEWMRQKWIPAMEIGMGHGYYVCLAPFIRAKAAYRALERSGKLRKTRSKH